MCGNVRDFFAAADDDRHALVNVRGLYVHDAQVRGTQRTSAGLFDDHRHGIGFVHEPQFALRCFLGGRIHEHATLQQDAMDVRHHGADVTAGIAALLGP
jgi:hypothetical protein